MNDDREETNATPQSSRRRVLAAAAMTGVLATGAARAQTAPQELRMATAWPKNSAGLGANAQRLADMIGVMSDGRLRVRVFAAGELVPALDAFAAVSDGRADLAHMTPHFAAGKNPSFRFFGNLPFGLTAHEHAAWLRFGGGQELWEEAYRPFGVVPLLSGTTGPQAGGWFRKEIKSLDDMKGLRMRAGGLGGEVLKRIGVNAVLTPPGEIAAALQSGSLDAAEWNGPWNDREAGLHRMAKYYYLPGVLEIGPMLELAVSQRVWVALSPDLQEIVRRAAAASAFETYAEFTYHNAASYPLVIQEGVEVRQFPEDVVAAMARASAALVTEIAGTSPLARKVYESYVKYRKAASVYAEVSDLAQLQTRAAVEL
jgi:TRAP-type mannitol/chloroaromatic compound transport system substrate-binding protein